MGIPGVKVNLPVEDVVVGTHVKKGVVHGGDEVGLRTEVRTGSVLRLKSYYENIHKSS
jgi:hypothetical protein